MKTKKLSRWLSVLLVLGMVLGMLPTALADNEITIEGEQSVENGAETTFTAKLPDGTTATDYSWGVSSSGGSAEIVDNSNKQSVKIKGTGIGNVTISVSVTTGGDSPSQLTGSCTLQVTEARPIPVTDISLNVSDTIELTEGETKSIIATITPDNAQEQTVSWTSSESDIVSISVDSNDGNKATIRAEKTGVPVTITAAAGGESATCTVTVKEKAGPTISLSPSATSVISGGKVNITATVANTSESVTWSASNRNVAFVKTGTQDSVAEATFPTVSSDTDITITARVSGVESTCRIKVTPVATPSITLPRSIDIQAGTTKNLTATVQNTNGTISWKSDNALVTFGSANGNTIPVVVSSNATAGTKITVTATITGVTPATCTVNVTAATKQTASLSPASLTMTPTGTNSQKTLSLTLNPSTPAVKSVTWSSTNTNIATVSGNKTSATVTARAAGSTEISAVVTFNDNSTQTIKCPVTVNKGTVSDVTYTVSSDKTVTFSARDFNSVCNNYTGYNLDYVKFSKNTNHGDLVYNYDSDSSNVRISTSNSYSYSSSNRSISNITFVPDESYTGEVTFNYEGRDSQGTTYNGRVVITVNGPSGDINYKTGKNEPIDLDPQDFQALCKKMVGGTLDYVTFGTTSKGTLYYDYEGSDEKKAGSSKYYYDEKPYLDDLTFVPGKNSTGTATISFTGYNTRRDSFRGTIEIVISGSGSASISYKTAKNKTVDLDSKDFNDYCKDETDYNLEWIKFTSLPSSSKGTLYYKYDTSKEEEVDKSTEYYRSGTPDLDDLTFVPHKDYEGTVTVDFKGENTNGKGFTGSFTIKVGNAADEGDISYTASAGTPVTFNVSDFNAYCKDETGYNLDYVKFSSLPSSSTGTLYYDYSSSSSSNKKVSTSTQYKRNSNPYLEKVTFVPAKSSTGDVEIKFTGKSTDGDSISGTVVITYTAVKNASTIRYSTGAGPLALKVSDFEAACNSRGAASLASVAFSLPNTAAGVLYYNYTGAGKYDGLVMPGVDYGARSGSYLLSYVSFVPTPGFVGTVTVSYTGTDTKGATFKGEVEITVSQANAKPTFTDMGNAQWAAEAVDYLYQRGITTGTSATTFSPAGKITRGDFILMLYRAFNLSASTTDNFKDVSSGDYYAQAIATAKALGIATGGGDGNFRPKADLTREDAMVFIQRTLSRTGRGVADAPATYLDKFPDGKNVADYAKGAVAALAQAGIIQGDDSGRLNPKGSLTRAEMAVILYRVLTK